MKISEILGSDGLKKFKARVRVGGTSVSIGIRAGSLFDARLALGKCYDKSNVLSVVEVQDINERQLKHISTRAIADQSKHQLVQKILLRRLLRRSNIVKPTSDDLEIAKNVVGRELKKANLEHERGVEQQVKLQHRQARRRKKKQTHEHRADSLALSQGNTHHATDE